MATGGDRNEVWMLSATSSPKNSGSMLKVFSSGRKIGMKMTMISVHSSGQPSMKMMIWARIMNPVGDRFIAQHELLDRLVAAEIGEHRREGERADEQPAHHRGGARGEEHRLLELGEPE